MSGHITDSFHAQTNLIFLLVTIAMVTMRWQQQWKCENELEWNLQSHCLKKKDGRFVRMNHLNSDTCNEDAFFSKSLFSGGSLLRSVTVLRSRTLSIVALHFGFSLFVKCSSVKYGSIGNRASVVDTYCFILSCTTSLQYVKRQKWKEKSLM